MKTLKCKNCDGLIEWEYGTGHKEVVNGTVTYTIGCPNCRQNVIYTVYELDRYYVDEPVVNDVEDEINKPSHYHKGGIDVIGYAEKKFSAEERKGFYRISALKYITRFEDKGQPLKDLNKAKFYVDKLIELQEGSE